MNNVSSAGNDAGTKRTAAAMVKGTVLALGISLAALAVLAVIMIFGNVPEWLSGPLAIAISLISVFFGASFAVRAIGEKGWMWGALCGVIYYIIIYLSALAAIREFNFSLRTAAMLALGALVGMVGGIFAMNSKSARRRR